MAIHKMVPPKKLKTFDFQGGTGEVRKFPPGNDHISPVKAPLKMISFFMVLIYGGFGSYLEDGLPLKGHKPFCN